MEEGILDQKPFFQLHSPRFYIRIHIPFINYQVMHVRLPDIKVVIITAIEPADNV